MRRQGAGCRLVCGRESGGGGQCFPGGPNCARRRQDSCAGRRRQQRSFCCFVDLPPSRPHPSCSGKGDHRREPGAIRPGRGVWVLQVGRLGTSGGAFGYFRWGCPVCGSITGLWPLLTWAAVHEGRPRGLAAPRGAVITCITGGPAMPACPWTSCSGLQRPARPRPMPQPGLGAGGPGWACAGRHAGEALRPQAPARRHIWRRECAVRAGRPAVRAVRGAQRQAGSAVPGG